MIEFILANIAMLSAGVVLYLVAHSLPRVGETETEPKGLLERWVASEFPEKLDRTFNTFAGKFLRKLRVVLLKFDNAVSASLKKVKAQDAAKPVDLFDTLNDGSSEVDAKAKIGDKGEASPHHENENKNESERSKNKRK